MKVLGYSRVSTQRQELSPAVQERLCIEWYEREKSRFQNATWEGMLFDKAVTSKIDLFDRPQGQHILTTLGPGDVLVVAKLSRAWRSAGDAERSLDLFGKLGIQCVILDFNIDTTTPHGRAIIGMMAVFARWEREIIRERIMEALDQRRREGKYFGRPPYGWKMQYGKTQKQNKMVPDEMERGIGELAAHMIAVQGMSVERTAVELNKAASRERKTIAKGGNVDAVYGKWAHSSTIRDASCYAILGWPLMQPKTIRRHIPGVFTRDFIVKYYTPPDQRLDWTPVLNGGGLACLGKV